MQGMKGNILEKLIEFFSNLQENEGAEKDQGELVPGHEGSEGIAKEMGEQPKGKLEMLSIQAKPKDAFDKMKGC